MSGKLFGQIVALMVIFIVLVVATKCTCKKFCPRKKSCTMQTVIK